MTGRDLSVTAALVARAREGDRDALAAIYERHYERVRRCAALTMGKTLRQCEQDVEDVVHDAFADAFRDIGRGAFDETRSEGGFRHWVAQIVVNRVRMRGRSARVRKERLVHDVFHHATRELDLAGREPGPATRAGDGEVQQAMLRLPDRDRRLIALRYLCDMTRREVADELGFANERQVSYAAQQAIGRLRRLLGVERAELEGYFGSL